jgi:hypothetical protein
MLMRYFVTPHHITHGNLRAEIQANDSYEKKSVPSSQETRYVSATKTNRFMLFRQKIAVSCENNIKREITL